MKLHVATSCSLILSLVVGHGHAQSIKASLSNPLLQCQPSSENNGQVFLPNIPDEHFNHESISDLMTDEGVGLTPANEDHTFVFTLPRVSSERTCSGIVVSIDFCYQISTQDINDNINIFNYLTLSKRGQEYVVLTRLRVRSTPTESICTNSTGEQNSEGKIICCDRETLPSRRQFQISPLSYTFAIMDRNVELLAFADSATEYNLEQFQVPLGGSGRPNTTFTVSEGNRFDNRSIPLFRFIIDPDEPSTEAFTTATTIKTSLTSDDFLDTANTDDNSFTDGINNMKKNTIIIGGLSGAVGVSALLVVILLVVVALMFNKNRRESRTANMKPLNCIPLHTRESPMRYETHADVCYNIEMYASDPVGTNSY